MDEREYYIKKMKPKFIQLNNFKIDDNLKNLVHQIIIDNVDQCNFNKLHSEFFIEKIKVDKQEHKDLIRTYLENLNKITDFIEQDIIDNTDYDDLYDDSDNVDHSVQKAVLVVVKKEYGFDDYLWRLESNIELYEEAIKTFKSKGVFWSAFDLDNFEYYEDYEIDFKTYELLKAIVEKIYDTQYLWELEHRLNAFTEEYECSKNIYLECFPKAFDSFKNKLINEAETFYKENKQNFEGYDFTHSVDNFEIHCKSYKNKTYIIEDETITANDEIISYIENKIKKEIFKDPDIQDIEENGKAYFEKKNIEENLKYF
jgi:hypothetical protein